MSHSVLSTFVLSALALALAGCTPASKEEPSPEPEPEAVAIPLAAIYSTNGQKGLIAVHGGATAPGGFDMDEMHREFRGGISNIFLANADDIVQAVSATRRAFTSGMSAEVPVLPRLTEVRRPAAFWMVVFLGIRGSEPPALLVRSVERKGKVIRLGFQRYAGGGKTKDSHRYFIWVPLGKLDSGKYTLELFDAETKEVTLTRRVTVGAK
jgi:hypothetical protein